MRDAIARVRLERRIAIVFLVLIMLAFALLQKLGGEYAGLDNQPRPVSGVAEGSL